MQRDAAYLILFHIKKFHKKMRENRNKMELKKQQAALNKNQKNTFKIALTPITSGLPSSSASILTLKLFCS